jgi:crotonobetainyl-CoA:carnitine CoA-transferase CaiB-like acyl-CoA transferase
LVDDAHLLQSGGLVPMETENGETQVVLLPLLMGGRRPGVRTPLPRIGEHTEQILDWLKTTRSTAVPA